MKNIFLLEKSSVVIRIQIESVTKNDESNWN